ncbi:MAG: hypothetical protein ACRDTD_27140, partial [Pseudonocardiaceae bacterium]
VLADDTKTPDAASHVAAIAPAPIEDAEYAAWAPAGDVPTAEPVSGEKPEPAPSKGPDSASRPVPAPIRARYPMPSLNASRSYPGAAPGRPEWRSAADLGWQRAVVAIKPRTGGTTAAGLPKRIPMANYVPGGIRTPQQAIAAEAPLRRSPEAVGSSLSRYRGGMDRGRIVAQNARSASTGESTKE